jgi:hypothetical protein
MKSIYINTRIIAVAITFILFGSCNPLDDIEQQFALDLDEAITDAESAEAVLGGAYIGLRGFGALGYPSSFSKMGLTVTPNFSGPDGFDTNMPDWQIGNIETIYLDFYRIVQEANLFLVNIENVPAENLGGESEKNNFIAEARFLRGFSHFMLLRAFGQHYDTNSIYGISLRETPALDKSPTPRSGVSEVYDSITADFQYAIDNCTGNQDFKANATAARALLAKVKLYEGDYEQAAILAQSVIDNPGGRTFADVYADNFSPIGGQLGIEAPGLIFGPYTDGDIFSEAIQPFYFSFGTIYESIALASADFSRFGASKWFAFGFVPGQGFLTNAPTVIHMRLAEVYLIHAEAKTRSGSGVDADALQSLNTVRTRTAIGLPALVDGVDIASKAELLEAIRKEKLLELYAEGGEEFFDMVRYSMVDGFDPSTVKPSMNNPDFYILPIPFSELKVQGASDVIMQNPGYPN